ncbi:hypothetical protein LTR37_006191 [Vermiconidia calcicola]|uniref:Uncharacterized protein n=1 Tax=Vermiconidia calcicola TaxID=1690605 RepID=A0ACC3NH62_9PEZI|nr:hypothetical protein LTR37_006191 [Vermiconidia calcicola]
MAFSELCRDVFVSGLLLLSLTLFLNLSAKLEISLEDRTHERQEHASEMEDADRKRSAWTADATQKHATVVENMTHQHSTVVENMTYQHSTIVEDMTQQQSIDTDNAQKTIQDLRAQQAHTAAEHSFQMNKAKMRIDDLKMQDFLMEFKYLGLIKDMKQQHSTEMAGAEKVIQNLAVQQAVTAAEHSSQMTEATATIWNLGTQHSTEMHEAKRTIDDLKDQLAARIVEIQDLWLHIGFERNNAFLSTTAQGRQLLQHFRSTGWKDAPNRDFMASKHANPLLVIPNAECISDSQSCANFAYNVKPTMDTSYMLVFHTSFDSPVIAFVFDRSGKWADNSCQVSISSDSSQPLSFKVGSSANSSSIASATVTRYANHVIHAIGEQSP